jgi:hypothetical protein
MGGRGLRKQKQKHGASSICDLGSRFMNAKNWRLFPMQRRHSKPAWSLYFCGKSTSLDGEFLAGCVTHKLARLLLYIPVIIFAEMRTVQ